jgi:hypothetical protein
MTSWRGHHADAVTPTTWPRAQRAASLAVSAGLLDVHGLDEEAGVPSSNKGTTMARKVADCRDFPSESGCTLTIAGTESEVLDAALHHAITVHGHEDTPEVRDWLRENLKDEVPA